MKRNWKRWVLAGVLVAGSLALGRKNGRADATRKDEMTPDVAALRTSGGGQAHIDVVFAIDCSGSMGPVIETAKKKVWTIVNEIAKAKPTPVLRIGLIGYGNADRTFRSFPLSDDLDTVYGNLMTFKDEGWSEEYVGLAVHKAVTEMKWSQDAAIDLKVIYVLGNETARQGPMEFDYAKTAPEAALKNIFVNAIYCNAGLGRARAANMNNSNNNAANPAGNAPVNAPTNAPSNRKGSSPSAPRQQAASSIASIPATGTSATSTPLDGEMTTWMEMALLGKGKFLEIAGDGGAVTIPTPFDAQMIALNNALNDTYIPYGRAGARGYANQKMQDTNAAAVGGAANMASRAQAKGGIFYRNGGWDLVDAARAKDFDWSKVKDEDLPASMKGKTPAERKQIVAENEQKRAALQTQLGALGRKRDEFLAGEIKKQNLDTGNAFDDAVRRSVVEQATARGYAF